MTRTLSSASQIYLLTCSDWIVSFWGKLVIQFILSAHFWQRTVVIAADPISALRSILQVNYYSRLLLFHTHLRSFCATIQKFETST